VYVTHQVLNPPTVWKLFRPNLRGGRMNAWKVKGVLVGRGEEL